MAVKDFVQAKAAVNLSANPSTVTLDASATAGNTLLCFVWYRQAFSNPDVTITATGITWNRRRQETALGSDTHHDFDLWIGIVTTGVTVVTATYNAMQLSGMSVVEYEGEVVDADVDVVEGAIDITEASSAVNSGATGTTTIANGLVVGAMANFVNGSNTTSFSASGFTMRASGSAFSFFQGCVAVGDINDSGAIGSTFTFAGSMNGNDRWAAIVAVLEFDTGGGGGGANHQLANGGLVNRGLVNSGLVG